jgi:lipopolysaccharide transport system ATP-binding protein
VQGGSDLQSLHDWSKEEMPGNENIKIRRAAVYAAGKSVDDSILTSDEIVFEVEFYNNAHKEIVDVTWDLMNIQGIHVAHLGRVCSFDGLERGWHKSRTTLPANLLNSERYVFNVMFGKNQSLVLYRMEEILTFDLEDDIKHRGNNHRKYPGVIHPLCQWEFESVSAA